MRSSGILLAISSLPSSYGIGTFGKEAYDFVDQLKQAGQKVWQVLPLGGTSYGDSPYQSFSTFAGNPYFIDLEILIDEGLLTATQCERLPYGSDPSSVDYEKIYYSRYQILKLAFSRDKSWDTPQYKKFVEENNYWLDDYTLFMAIKDHFKGVSFLEWDKAIKHREPKAMQEYRKLLSKEIDFYCFVQYKFFEQWNKLKGYANENEVEIVGDIPIYVALDSADTWSNPELFMFDENLNPTRVAGCPPDYFAKTGQLWGNPLYEWEVHKKNGYAWWIRRIEAATKMYNTVRIDHFRGFCDYYSIPAEDKTAENGVWVKGPNIELFECLKERLGKLNIIAEDLGFLTPAVKKMLKKSGFPGMKILQFGLYEDSDSDYLPYKYKPNTICYTGTHDNQTTVGWLKTRKPRDKRFIRDYLQKKGRINVYDIIALGLSSVSDLVIVPMQDYLELDDTARMNIPSTIGGNWQWRLTKEQITDEVIERIAKLTKIYGR